MYFPANNISECCAILTTIQKTIFSRESQERLGDCICENRPDSISAFTTFHEIRCAIRSNLDHHDSQLIGYHLQEGTANPEEFRRVHNAAVRELYKDSYTGEHLRAEVKQFATEVDMLSTDSIFAWAKTFHSIVQEMEKKRDNFGKVAVLLEEVLTWEAAQEAAQAEKERLHVPIKKRRRKHVSVALKARLAREYQRKYRELQRMFSGVRPDMHILL